MANPASEARPSAEDGERPRDLALADPAAVLAALIRCPSVTPADAGALGVLAACLRRLGFTVERPAFGEGEARVENLYARLGDSGPFLVFAGHTDVVPPGDATRWSRPPFGGEIAGGYVHGRGAVDMKGGIAAMVAATARLLASGERPSGSVAFLVTGDEEGPAINGTVRLLDWARQRGECFDHCVLGEPTNPSAMGEMVKIGRRGSLTGHLTVTGKQGHVAYPDRVDNPLHRLPAFIDALTRQLDEGSAHFDASSLQVVTVDTGNAASNVVPGETRLRFNIRFNDRWSPTTLAAEIEARCQACGTAFTLRFEPTNSVSFLTKPGPFVDLVSRAVEAETGREPALSTSGGTSDARFIKDVCEVVEFGLVGDTMHAVDERAAIADLETLTSIYGRILRDYLAPAIPG